MRRYCLFFVLLNICFACGKNAKSVMPINEMKIVMWDMMNADNWYSSMTIKDTMALKDKRNIALYQQVFKWHQITQEQFYKSYHYYELHPEEMKILFDSLESYATKQRMTFEGKPIKAKAIAK
jgi:hypothetical protein